MVYYTFLISESMILKVEDAMKPFRRTDPDCEARRDLIGLYTPLLAAGRFIKRIGEKLCI